MKEKMKAQVASYMLDQSAEEIGHNLAQVRASEDNLLAAS
jgi:hypothetical protein